MRDLFFHAVAGHPRIASALMGQATATLAPFDRYLRQAIKTAKQRQFRYELPWEPVRRLVTYKLEPLERVVFIPRPPPRTLFTGWPEGIEPDRSQPGFVINRSVPFQVEAVSATASGLEVRADIRFEVDDEVVWCRQSCRVHVEASSPPTTILTGAGEPLELLEPARELDGDWRLTIAGVEDDCELIVEGKRTQARVLPAFGQLNRVVDEAGRSFEVRSGALREEEAPSSELLRGDDGLRYRWREQGSSGRRGAWVQLLLPESEVSDEFMDPRAAFCEGDVREVWTQPRHNPAATYKVKRVDQDRYQLLLDRYPSEGSKLYLPVNIRNLYLQRRALYQLREAPLPHHQGLIRLCEDPQRARWPRVEEVAISEQGWRSLRDATRSGTDQQRAFVRQALGSPDLALLEGPPGSGKTTAICELVQQLLEDGKRVLMCASTHVAIDNVLERLLESDAPVDAVRIGKLDRVDAKVQSAQIDERVEALLSTWRGLPSMRGFGDGELADMAERTVIMAANLTCGTTMGIVNHPLFRGRDEDLQIWQRPISTMPHWDMLIIDEASKTLIQEFMVPALMAKRWVIVGDVQQLPPFTDRADIVANLRDLLDEEERPVFPPDHQRACLLLFRLLRPVVCQTGMRWLIVEAPGVIEWLARELEVEPPPGLEIVKIARRAEPSGPGLAVLGLDQLRAGEAETLRLAAADWVLVADDLLDEVEDLLPSNLLLASDPTGPGDAALTTTSALMLRQAWWLERAGRLPKSYRDRSFGRQEVASFADSQRCEQRWLARHDLAQEMTWRLTRIHELRRSRRQGERERLDRALNQLLPRAADIGEAVEEIEDIGLPSILEVLQEGIGAERARRPSSLTAGMRETRPKEFELRFQSLSYQHRMHPDIAAFPRELIYSNRALRDANTIEERDNELGWDFGSFPGRRVWWDVDGREQAGTNADEVAAMRDMLRDFIAWARAKGRPRRSSPKLWEVACLSFYVKQEGAISEMLRELTGDRRRTRFRASEAPVEFACGTVDRFQGREADLVLLSMRNTGRVGFLDSPNRLNVAVTRARQQLVVFGKADYFQGCRIEELEELVRRSPKIEGRGGRAQRQRRGRKRGRR